MKHIVRIALIVLLSAVCILTMVSCAEDDLESGILPLADAEKAYDALLSYDYEATLEDAQEELDAMGHEGLIALVTATKGTVKSTETITIYYFSDTTYAQDAYEILKKENKGKNLIVNQYASRVWCGTEAAIEAASKEAPDNSSHVHINEGGGIVTDPTCTTDGYVTYKCAICGESYQDLIRPATGHDYSKKSYKATCTTGAYDVYTCKVCTHSYQETTSDPDPLTHTELYDDVKAATCTEAGYEYEKCRGCAYSLLIQESSPLGHQWGSDDKCTLCGKTNPGYVRVNAAGKEDANGEYILFGQYPQSLVTDSSIVERLKSKAGDVPPSFMGTYNWTSYEYGVPSSYERQDFMWYRDIEHNGEKYRAVYFIAYRPSSKDYSPTETYSRQDDNGYFIETEYFFKYEPVKWRIVQTAGNTATLVADLVIDSYEFYPEFYTDGNPNNYAESAIRAWLNDSFYKTAFNTLEKSVLVKSTVVNDAASTGQNENQYACENTQDYVYLLSYVEANKYFTSASALQKETTDYAKCQGVLVSKDGNTAWWLRSAFAEHQGYVCHVQENGEIRDTNVDRTLIGVCPVLKITLK